MKRALLEFLAEASKSERFIEMLLDVAANLFCQIGLRIAAY